MTQGHECTKVGVLNSQFFIFIIISFSAVAVLILSFPGGFLLFS